MADNLVVGLAFDGATGAKTGANLEDLVALAEFASATPLLDQSTLEDYDNAGTRAARVKDAGITAAKLAAILAFSAHNNGVGQHIAKGNLYQPLDLSTELFDVGGCFAASAAPGTAGIFTPTTAGIYLLTGGVVLADVGSEEAGQAAIAKNGAVVNWGSSVVMGKVGDFYSQVTVLIEANGTTDYFELCGWAGGSGTQGVAGSSKYTYFMGHFVGAS